MTKEPIRVLRVIARLNVGGPALHVSQLAAQLDERGYETTLVAGRVGEGEGSMEWVAEQLGVKPVYIPALQREISPAADVPAVAELRRLIREHRPDILHTHTAKAGAVGRMAAALAGDHRPKVVVHTFHGHVLRGYFSPFRTTFFRKLERNLARLSDALIAVSPEVRDDLVRLGVARDYKIWVIRLGLDLAGRTATDPQARARVRESLGIPDDRFVVAWLGRMTEIKRTDDLLRAFALLRERRDAHLLLVGDGPLRPQLEQLAAKLAVADRCHFVGYQSDIADFLQASDAVALTSANEGTPVSLIEALAAGKPVVTTDVGGVRDVVELDSGVVVQPGDIDAVADGLELLAGDPELRDRLGATGRGRVLERYSVPRLVDDIDSLYRLLLDRADPHALTPALVRPPTRLTPIERRLKVAIVSQYFPPEVGATQSRMQAFAEYLAERGHDVTVICEFPNHPHGVLPPQYRERLLEDDRTNPYRVLRVWVRTSQEKTQRTRMALYLSYMAMATAVTPLTGRPDVVVATSPPLFAGVAGYAISRLTGAPLVLDIRDLWPAAAVSLNQISAGITLHAAELLERHLYRQAAAVIAVTQPFTEHIDRLRQHGPATILIPNGTLELFFEQNGSAPRETLGAHDGRYLVTFAGTHGIAQALPAVLEAAPLVADLADFAFVGDGPLKEQLLSLAAERGLTNVTFLPQEPLERIPAILAASDALLVPLSGHPTFADFVPSKMIDYMAAGKPILLSAAGESARLLESSGGGVVVAPENPEALATAIRRLAADPDAAARMGERGRAFAAKRLRSVQAERLEQLLLDITRA
ncbi:MAG TPA: glycosyltransferase [Gaiellaceae bacterium]|jgi:glycosyltransferase involved in cell wall biosynthesis